MQKKQIENECRLYDLSLKENTITHVTITCYSRIRLSESEPEHRLFETCLLLLLTAGTLYLDCHPLVLCANYSAHHGYSRTRQGIFWQIIIIHGVTQMQTHRSVPRRLYTVLHVFLACRVPWVSPMATGVTINHQN